MKPTKLEEYITILQILLTHGPIQLTEIESFVSLKRIELRKDLAFLLEQNVIEKYPSGTTPVYIVSPLDLRIVKYFSLNTVVSTYRLRIFWRSFG